MPSGKIKKKYEKNYFSLILFVSFISLFSNTFLKLIKFKLESWRIWIWIFFFFLSFTSHKKITCKHIFPVKKRSKEWILRSIILCALYLFHLLFISFRFTAFRNKYTIQIIESSIHKIILCSIKFIVLEGNIQVCIILFTYS